jgi:hypothetical protein
VFQEALVRGDNKKYLIMILQKKKLSHVSVQGHWIIIRSPTRRWISAYGLGLLRPAAGLLPTSAYLHAYRRPERRRVVEAVETDGTRGRTVADGYVSNPDQGARYGIYHSTILKL